MIIEYSKDGLAFSDFEIEEILLTMYKNDLDFKTANELAILAARYLIKIGKIDYKKITFMYNELPIRVDKNGELESFPSGFCESSEKYLMCLAGWTK